MQSIFKIQNMYIFPSWILQEIPNERRVWIKNDNCVCSASGQSCLSQKSFLFNLLRTTVLYIAIMHSNGSRSRDCHSLILMWAKKADGSSSLSSHHEKRHSATLNFSSYKFFSLSILVCCAFIYVFHSQWNCGCSATCREHFPMYLQMCGQMYTWIDMIHVDTVGLY